MRITACVLLVVALVLLCIPGTSAIGANMLYMGFKFAISGMVVGGIMSGIIAAITGNDFWDAVQQGMVDGFVSGFSMGAIVGFFSALPCVCGNCFKAGTLVLTETGHKKIEDIKVGDKVWAYDEKTKTNKLKKVVRLFRNKTKEWFHIFINKQEIVCTGEHPFYINNKGWVKARDLIENDEVIHYNEDVSKINKIYKEVLDTPEDTYNFEVEDCHTYYVTDSDVLVHNMCVTGSAEETNVELVNEKPDHTWPTERRRYWKSQGKLYEQNITGNLSPSETYIINRDNVNLMLQGNAPIGIDEYPVQLHHVVGKSRDFFNYIEVTKTYHYSHFKNLHWWLYK